MCASILRDRYNHHSGKGLRIDLTKRAQRISLSPLPKSNPGSHPLPPMPSGIHTRSVAPQEK